MKKKIRQTLGTKKNHEISLDKKNQATFRDNTINFATSQDKKNYATSLDKKIRQPLGTKNYATSRDKKNHATSWDKNK